MQGKNCAMSDAKCAEYYSCQFPAVSREPTKIQAEQTIGGQLCRVINACSANAA